MKKSFLSIFLLFFLFNLKAQQIYYVKPYNSGGRDGDTFHNGSNWDRAFASLSYACEVAQEGSTIYLAPGEYEENNFILPKSNTTILGNLSGEGPNTIIRARYTTWGGRGANPGQWGHYGICSIFEGFGEGNRVPAGRLAAKTAAYYLMWIYNKNNVYVEGITFSNEQSQGKYSGADGAIAVINGTGNTIHKCYFENFRMSGIYAGSHNNSVLGALGGLTIENNFFYNTSYSGAFCQSSNLGAITIGNNYTQWANNVVVRNNCFFTDEPRGYGIRAEGVSNLQIIGNLIKTRHDFSIEIAHAQVSNVFIHDNELHGVVSVPGPGHSSELSISIFRNLFHSSYAIEGPRPKMEISYNMFLPPSRDKDTGLPVENLNDHKFSSDGTFVDYNDDAVDYNTTIHHNIFLTYRNPAFRFARGGHKSNLKFYNNTFFMFNIGDIAALNFDNSNITDIHVVNNLFLSPTTKTIMKSDEGNLSVSDMFFAHNGVFSLNGNFSNTSLASSSFSNGFFDPFNLNIFRNSEYFNSSSFYNIANPRDGHYNLWDPNIEGGMADTYGNSPYYPSYIGAADPISNNNASNDKWGPWWTQGQSYFSWPESFPFKAYGFNYATEENFYTTSSALRPGQVHENNLSRSGLFSKSAKKQALLVTPNPSKEVISLSNSSDTIQEVIIKTLMGKVIFQKQITGGHPAKEINLDLSFLPKGMYFLEAYLVDKTILSQKIILE